MTYNEYRDALAKLGLSQMDAARMLCVGSRTSRRWALGESEIPYAVALILRLMIAKKIKPQTVANRTTITGEGHLLQLLLDLMIVNDVRPSYVVKVGGG